MEVSDILERVLMVTFLIAFSAHAIKSQYWTSSEKVLWFFVFLISLGLSYPIFLIATFMRIKRKNQELGIEEKGFINWLAWLFVFLCNLTFAWLFLAFSVTDKIPLSDQPVRWVVGYAVAIPLAISAYLMLQKKFRDGLKCSAYTIPFLLGLAILFSVLLS